MCKNDKELAVELACSYITALSNIKNPYHAVTNKMAGINGGGNKYVITPDDVTKAFDIFYKHISETN